MRFNEALAACKRWKDLPKVNEGVREAWRRVKAWQASDTAAEAGEQASKDDAATPTEDGVWTAWRWLAPEPLPSLTDKSDELCSWLAYGEQLAHRCDSSEDALRTGSEHGLVGVVRLMLRLGAKVDATDWAEQTVMYKAVMYGRARVCRLLLAAGTDPNAADGMGQTLLHTAAHAGHLAVCKLLLAAGANVNALDAMGGNALVGPAQRGHEAVCKLLVQAGINVNNAGFNGQTALHTAWGSPAVRKTLVQGGADVNAVDAFGGTPLEAVTSGEERRTLRTLAASRPSSQQ